MEYFCSPSSHFSSVFRGKPARWLSATYACFSSPLVPQSLSNNFFFALKTLFLPLSFSGICRVRACSSILSLFPLVTLSNRFSFDYLLPPEIERGNIPTAFSFSPFRWNLFQSYFSPSVFSNNTLSQFHRCSKHWKSLKIHFPFSAAREREREGERGIWILLVEFFSEFVSNSIFVYFFQTSLLGNFLLNTIRTISRDFPWKLLQGRAIDGPRHVENTEQYARRCLSSLKLGWQWARRDEFPREAPQRIINWLRTVTSDRTVHTMIRRFLFLLNSSVRHHWIEIIEK